MGVGCAGEHLPLFLPRVCLVARRVWVRFVAGESAVAGRKRHQSMVWVCWLGAVVRFVVLMLRVVVSQTPVRFSCRAGEAGSCG